MIFFFFVLTHFYFYSDIQSQPNTIPKRIKDKSRKNKKLKIQGTTTQQQSQGSQQNATQIVDTLTTSSQNNNNNSSDQNNVDQILHNTAENSTDSNNKETQSDILVTQNGGVETFDDKNTQPIMVSSPKITVQLDQHQHQQQQNHTNFDGLTIETTVQSFDSNLKIEKNVENGFCCVISMQDGIVLFTTPSITDSLGFPRDMWLGRSFIDFVHPKDRSTFASQITSGVEPFTELKSGSQKDLRNSLYVKLRRYRGLQTVGYGVTNKAVTYEPFQLVLSFRKAPEERGTNSLSPANSTMLLVICATPVRSIYKGKNLIDN